MASVRGQGPALPCTDLEECPTAGRRAQGWELQIIMFTDVQSLLSLNVPFQFPVSGLAVQGVRLVSAFLP